MAKEWRITLRIPGRLKKSVTDEVKKVDGEKLNWWIVKAIEAKLPKAPASEG